MLCKKDHHETMDSFEKQRAPAKTQESINPTQVQKSFSRNVLLQSELPLRSR
jgi:hypothetical protein